MNVIRANRQLAGKPCPACQTEVLLGQEVVQCQRCGGVHHSECWQRTGRCAAPGCTPVEAAAPAAAPPAAPAPPASRPCPLCAEQIPAGAVICPYCGESLVSPTTPGVPNRFEATCRGHVWNFVLTPNQLIARSSLGNEEVRVSRESADADIIMKGRGFFTAQNRLFIRTDTGQYKFVVRDMALALIECWRTGQLKPRTCSSANDALTTAIVGIFCFGIILQGVALYRAKKAREELDAFPTLLKGKGLVTAARIISIAYYVIVGGFFLLGIIAGSLGK